MEQKTKLAAAAFLIALLFGAVRADDGISGVIPGWQVKSTPLGSFTFGTEHTEGSLRDKSAFLEMTTPNPAASGVLQQNVLAEPYRGKRVRVSARIKTASAVGAQLFMRINDADGKRLTYDNMEARTISGTTDWKRYAAVLDVPQNGQIIWFGIYVNGANGPERVWAEDFKLEEVSKDVPLTALDGPLDKAPINTGFEQMTGWHMGGGPMADFDFGIEPTAEITASNSGFIVANKASATQFESLGQGISPDSYRGKRVRLTALMKTRDAANAELWMNVEDVNRKSISFDNMVSNPVTGTTDWKRYTLVLDVPRESHMISFGFFLTGGGDKSGKVWATDFRLQPVGTDEAITHDGITKMPENMNFDQ